MSESEIGAVLSSQEWSVFVECEEIDDKPVSIELSLPDECKTPLCNRLNLHGIEQLQATLMLSRHAVNKAIHIKGEIIASIQQKCVVTMEPVSEVVKDKFESWYTDKSQTVSFVKAKRERMSAQDQEEQAVLDEEDDPEAIIGGRIDVGELVVQNFSLALNPYPRIEGARGNFGEQLGNAPEGTYDNPFAALKDWKTAEKKKGK